MSKAGFILAVVSAGVLGAQTLDLSALDKLEKKAKEANTVTFDAGQIRGAMALLGMVGESDKDVEQVKSILSGVKGLVVRNLEFADKGEYPMEAVDSVRAQIAKMPGWSKIVESRSAEEHDEVYILSQSDKIAGLAVICAEPKELTVVYINGAINLSDLRKLRGQFGIPDIDIHGQEPAKKD
ncbi:MAG TPA: DUF4252 domain-containing protein [Bryobacteraceae bacterium]|nr:DUF4252 domain-containing protein [Bryobacteraceae bacterium]